MTGLQAIPGGSLVALATPFRDGIIDTDAFARLCERQIARGTGGLVVCGTTGEAPALSLEEHVLLFRLSVSVADGRVPVIAGCSGASTEMAASVAKCAAQSYVSALLCAPTPYVKPSQDGIIAHIRKLAHVSDLPVLLYDVPSRTSIAVRDDTVAILFERGLVFGIKDATSDLARPTRLRRLCGDGLLQLSGDDATAAAYRAAGGDGCISVTANVAPALCARLHHTWDAGDLTLFAHTRDLLGPLHDALFVESNPVPLKTALEILSLANAEMRLPLLRAKPATRTHLNGVMADIMAAEEAAGREARHVWAS